MLFIACAGALASWASMYLVPSHNVKDQTTDVYKACPQSLQQLNMYILYKDYDAPDHPEPRKPQNN
eukprot:5331625-Amphidinium_carterae.1